LTGSHDAADHSFVPRRFSPDEANDALDVVRPLAERMVAHRRALRDLQGRQRALVMRIASNGGDLTPSDVSDLAEEIEREAQGMRECVVEIERVGAIVKDLDEGLVDFPSEREGEPVLLCWRVGEDAIRYYHGEAEGFAGRKPLDG
jgi:hypothetical protein